MTYTTAPPGSDFVRMLFKDVLVYKYGCSHARFHNLGGMQFLFWKTLQEHNDFGGFNGK